MDELDRVTLVDYSEASSPATSYAYEDPFVPFSKGSLTKIERNGAAIDYGYDRFGRLTQEGALAYAYDKNGNRLNVVYPGGVTAIYSFDFADRQQTLTVQRSGLPDQPVASAAVYQPSGPLADLQLGNGLSETRAFTSRYFPSDIQVNGASTILQWLYTTDAVGNILQITDGLDATQNRTYATQDFQYFLTQGDGPWGTRTWTYDKIGNRLSEIRDALPQEDYLYLPNGAAGNTPILDQIQVAAATLRDYGYGPAGHLERVTAGANEILFTSDAEGRLSRLMRDAGDARSDFTYDGRSFLTNASAGPAVTVFTDGFETGDTRCWAGSVGDPNPPTPENCSPFPETLPTYSSDGLLHAVTKDPGQPGELTKYYLYFAGRPITQLDRTPTGTETFRFLTTDHLRTPILATDLTGTILWQGGFEPFGGDWSGAGATEIDLRFPGQWADESWAGASLGSEVYYNVHRWLEFGTGRYGPPVSR